MARSASTLCLRAAIWMCLVAARPAVAQMQAPEEAVPRSLFLAFVDAEDLSEGERALAMHLHEEHAGAMRAGAETAERVRRWFFSSTSPGRINYSIRARDFLQQVSATRSDL